MRSERAKQILDHFSGKRILVLGDVMLDEYIWGHASRISPEAPVIVVDANRYSQVPGGAANVVNNLCALGAKVSVFGVVGRDEYGRGLIQALEDEGADTSGLLALPDHPTTRKTRVIAHSQQIVRVDHERRQPLDSTEVGDLISLLETAMLDADALLLSDYQKGVLVPHLLDRVIELANAHGLLITGNLKPAAIIGRCPITVITLNLHEASLALSGMPLSSHEALEAGGRDLLARTGAEHLLVTRGAQGLNLFSPDGSMEWIPPRLVEVYDAAGAGDTVISAMTLSLAAGATAIEAVNLANDAAAEVVKKLGVATVTRQEILSGITSRL